jgi:DNA helicase MCM8
MLRSAAAVSPRAVYVCGNTSTTAGLTVSLSRDAQSSHCNIEAGALVLADKGVCCIDEFDKLTCDAHSLLEAMEQQSVSVAKAGVVASLRCRSAVLAAANPIGGHYDKRKSV